MLPFIMAEFVVFFKLLITIVTVLFYFIFILIRLFFNYYYILRKWNLRNLNSIDFKELMYNQTNLVTSSLFFISLFLQIILAFGNYMNSSRRGTASGFKLQTLDRVRR